MKKSVLLKVFVCSFFMAAVHSNAKTVVCISNEGDGFLTNGEGYHRAAGHDVTVGGNLTECMDQVEDGDCLVIVAHGQPVEIDGKIDYGFCWNGTTYMGFGNGAKEMKVPADFKNLKNVTVKFQACWSDCDGIGKSVLDDLVCELGDGATGEGYPGVVDFSIYWDTKCGTKKQRDKADKCLSDDDSWMDNPPVNNPDAGTKDNPNQQQAAQAILDAKKIPVKVTIPPVVGDPGGEKKPCRKGYLPPVALSVAPEPDDDGFYEQAGMGSEPNHDYADLFSQDGRWHAQVEVNSNGVGQIVGLKDYFTQPEQDQVFETLHYVAIGAPGNARYYAVEDYFEVMDHYADGNTFEAMLMGLPGEEGDLSWLQLHISGTVLSDMRGVAVTLTFTAIAPTAEPFVNPLVYVDMEVEENKNDNMVNFDGNFIQMGPDGADAMQLYTPVVGGFQSMAFPFFYDYVADGPGFLENSIEAGPGNMTIAVEGFGQELFPGESTSFAYCLGRAMGFQEIPEQPTELRHIQPLER